MSVAVQTLHDPGRGNAYRYDQGCRCEECRAAKFRKRREARARGRAAQSPSYLHELASARARHARMTGTCIDCGGPTRYDGTSTGPQRCSPCNHAARVPEHGTISRYTSKKWRCRCPLCTRANTDYHRALRRRHREAANSHSGSKATP